MMGGKLRWGTKSRPENYKCSVGTIKWLLKMYTYSNRTPGYARVLNGVRLFMTPWAGARQPPLSLRFFKQEYWSGLPFPSPGDRPDPRIELGPPALQSDSLWSEPQNIIQQ